MWLFAAFVIAEPLWALRSRAANYLSSNSRLAIERQFASFVQRGNDIFAFIPGANRTAIYHFHGRNRTKSTPIAKRFACRLISAEFNSMYSGAANTVIPIAINNASPKMVKVNLRNVLPRKQVVAQTFALANFYFGKVVLYATASSGTLTGILRRGSHVRIDKAGKSLEVVFISVIDPKTQLPFCNASICPDKTDPVCRTGIAQVCECTAVCSTLNIVLAPHLNAPATQNPANSWTRNSKLNSKSFAKFAGFIPLNKFGFFALRQNPRHWTTSSLPGIATNLQTAVENVSS